MEPTCSHCGADAVAFTVPEAIREHVTLDSSAASLCRVCLTVDTLDEQVASAEPLTIISEVFPDDSEAAAMVAVVVGLLESLALHRHDIQAVIDQLEAQGVDPLLVLERLAEDPSLTPAIDLERRLHQLGQLLE